VDDQQIPRESANDIERLRVENMSSIVPILLFSSSRGGKHEQYDYPRQYCIIRGLKCKLYTTRRQRVARYSASQNEETEYNNRLDDGGG